MSAQGNGIPHPCIDCGAPVHTFGFRCGVCYRRRAYQLQRDYLLHGPVAERKESQ